ncbi:RNA polymerase II-associated protein [Mycena albidolilacea]|uniref:RNA polymerase II-associated protein n=1 Tax=Mycena albidolilacea TaxID=1033008 RepID=A0AAD6Z5J6_9AGAR|nr:RNA polymerase II-associated protein [Mycena albidolilacea]
MSSKKNSKLDLLVRVRYSNPLPAPPCPPKLVDIPTNPMRYARPEFLNALAHEMPLPMIVDAECGMPLDLGRWESLWLGEDLGDTSGGDIKLRWAALDAELNPDPYNLPLLDPEDAALLAELAPAAPSFGGNSQSASGPSTPLPAHVPWLRKTEYISREGVQRSGAHESKHIIAAPIDVSRDAQLRDIEASFAACNDNFSLETLRHPNKPNVHAVESYEVLPDKDIWANQYDLFRFSERPGERTLDVDDPRLDCAILRPMKTEHDSFLAYYLTADDESALNFKQTRAALAPYAVPADRAETIFHFVRDYETVKVEQEVPNEFMLVIEDHADDAEDVLGEAPKPKGAYYKNIERKMHLKKKRVNAYEGYNDKWEIIRMTHVEIGEEEEAERNELLAEVENPRFLREDVDADGDVELDDVGPIVV